MTATATPQHLQALERANHVRSARAERRRELKRQSSREASRARCAELLLEPPRELKSMPVVDLLLCCRRVGLRAAVSMLRAAQVSQNRPVEDLTTAQRERLAQVLRCC